MGSLGSTGMSSTSVVPELVQGMGAGLLREGLTQGGREREGGVGGREGGRGEGGRSGEEDVH